MQRWRLKIEDNYMTEALTFEKVWEMFREDREQMRIEREQRQKEWEKRQKEWEKLEKQMKETDRKIGEMSNRFGELAEHLVAPNILEKFQALGFTFEEISQNKRITDSSGNDIAEIDLLLENGDIVMAVEVKAKPIQKDIDRHIERIEVLRKKADKRNDTRKFQGAIAGAIMTNEVRNYIHRAGFYAIEQTGDTVKINIPKDFIAREW